VSAETESDPPNDSALAGKALDSVLALFPPIKAMLIDVRVNIGGNDEFAYAVADRFTNKKMVGHTKRIRNGGYEEFGPAQEWYIEPKGKKQFTVPVAVLTNDQTASAGDVFAMIMKALPDVKTVGENTLGIYSDMYGFELPNKWLVSLSNQRYYAADGKCYEGTGTPVDRKIKNSRKDLQTGKDPVVIAAISVLQRKVHK
jgi:C-terminal processing protease CtpA/Prc